MESKPVRYVSFETSDRAATFPIPAQQFGKNLNMTPAINESRTGFSNRRQSNCHCVSVSNRCPLKTRSAFNAVGLAEQLANSDPRFAWVAFPLSDRVRNEIVEPE